MIVGGLQSKRISVYYKYQTEDNIDATRHDSKT